MHVLDHINRGERPIFIGKDQGYFSHYGGGRKKTYEIKVEGEATSLGGGAPTSTESNAAANGGNPEDPRVAGQQPGQEGSSATRLDGSVSSTSQGRASSSQRDQQEEEGGGRAAHTSPASAAGGRGGGGEGPQQSTPSAAPPAQEEVIGLGGEPVHTSPGAAAGGEGGGPQQEAPTPPSPANDHFFDTQSPPSPVVSGGAGEGQETGEGVGHKQAEAQASDPPHLYSDDYYHDEEEQGEGHWGLGAAASGEGAVPMEEGTGEGDRAQAWEGLVGGQVEGEEELPQTPQQGQRGEDPRRQGATGLAIQEEGGGVPPPDVGGGAAMGLGAEGGSRKRPRGEDGTEDEELPGGGKAGPGELEGGEEKEREDQQPTPSSSSKRAHTGAGPSRAATSAPAATPASPALTLNNGAFVVGNVCRFLCRAAESVPNGELH